MSFERRTNLAHLVPIVTCILGFVSETGQGKAKQARAAFVRVRGHMRFPRVGLSQPSILRWDMQQKVVEWACF